MTVSAIAVGPAADVELLTNIAKWGKGRSYVVADAKEVPQIFVKEAKEATTPAFDEKSLKPVVKVKGFLEGVDLTKAPALRGRTAVVTKDTALEMLTTEDGDPLLSFWPIGLGRTAVFASDVKDRWASDWLKWRGYAPFFSAVVHAIERQRPLPLALDVQPGPIRDGARTVTVVVESRDARGQYRDSLRPVVSAKADDGTTAQVPARQVGPGRYEARIVADAKRSLTVSVAGPDGEHVQPADRALIRRPSTASARRISICWAPSRRGPAGPCRPMAPRCAGRRSRRVPPAAPCGRGSSASRWRSGWWTCCSGACACSSTKPPMPSARPRCQARAARRKRERPCSVARS